MDRTARGIAYREEGDGEPVLLIHGSLVADSFEPMAPDPALADFQLIRYHRRGMGDSSVLGWSPLLSDHVDDAADVLGHLGIGRSHVVGHSFGGLIATQLALDRPELVQSLTLFEPVLRPAAEAAEVFTTLFAPLIERASAGETDEAIGLFAGFVFGAAWAEEFEEAMPGSVAQMHRDAAAFFEGDLRAMEHRTISVTGDAQVIAPVLLVTGAEGLPVDEDYVRDHAPQTQSTVIDDVNHAMHMSAPRPLAETIAAFCEQHAIG